MIGVKWRKANEAMDAVFCPEVAVSVVALDLQHGALYPSLFAGRRIQHLGMEAPSLRPPDVHPQQHLRPVLRLGATGTGVESHNRVPAIVFATKKQLKIEPLDVRRYTIDL